MVRIHFEPHLKHQVAAVDAVVRVFEGAPFTRPEEKVWTGEVSSNVLRISKEQIQENVARLATEQNIEDYAPTDEPDFSIEMETGTGKTYVYIRTIFQLHKQYGLHKFMIVVPSVAIREGVLATFRDTLQHFREIYGETASVIEYDSKHLPAVHSFCSANHLSVMVMNKQAFDKANSIINAEDRDGGNLLEQICKVQPVIVMDEPQEGMDTPNMKNRLAAFNPLFKLRYSATHRHPKNIINRLTPYDAYNSGLVKKISVLSIHETGVQSNVAIRFRNVNLRPGKEPTASLFLNVRLKNGDITEKAVTVKRIDHLAEKTNNPVYDGWIVENLGTTDIFDGEGWVKFTNGEQINEGEEFGSDKEEIFRQQIRRTIQNHFLRKKQLVPLGIKALALFFVDRVGNYVESDGLVRRLFMEEYIAAYRGEHDKSPANVEEVHGGYFARNRTGYTDNARTMQSEVGRAIYDRILKDKSKLLSMDDPLEFIFTHSALGVGWDNPNVFTICTLNESISRIKKRQEIGRGLRLCVQQDGQRYRDSVDVEEGQEVNLLTVVPNESYQAFVATYQTELREEMGQAAVPPEIRDSNQQPTKITRFEDRFSSEAFVELWKKIAQRTHYQVHFDEDRLIAKGVEALSRISVEENELEISIHRWDSLVQSDDDVEVAATYTGGTKASVRSQGALLDIVGELSRDTSLATMTTAKILGKLPEIQLLMLAKNPIRFMAEATKALRRVVDEELVGLVHYEKSDKVLPMEDLFNATEETVRDVTPTPNRGLYDHIIHDYGVEKNMAISFDAHSTVKLFFKLPSKYKIPTPIGNYTPDFALVMEKRAMPEDGAEETFFYFIIETKGTGEIYDLKPDERMKIEFAIKHFAALGLKGYLAPINSAESFDEKSFRAVGETFFSQ